MTLAEFEEKIENLEVVKVNASGMDLIDLAEIIDDLETAQVRLTTEVLGKLKAGISSQDITDLKNIAAAFEKAANDIAEANKLIDTAISIGKKMVGIVKK